MSMSNTTTNHNSSSSSQPSSQPLHVLFLHLDLGIGGAEQLVLQLASASQSLDHTVTLLTTRCDADHCFAVVKPPDGALSRHVQVWGRWIPANVMGMLTALCSHVRVLYLALWLCWYCSSTPRGTGTRVLQPPDLIVVDVLPTPLWLLRYFTRASLLFYCHFPDKLLIRSQNPLMIATTTTTTTTTSNQPQSSPPSSKSVYRKIMDAMEEYCMPLADSLLVNSKFTKHVVLQEFPSLQEHDLQVLYPALDTSSSSSTSSSGSSGTVDNNSNNNSTITVVSLNRYERKKKIELILYAYALIRDQFPPHSLQVIIAGGYDTQNVENVEYRGELERIAFKELQLTKDEVVFQTSISDAERSRLLQTARCVVYTPPNEHFGIVPLEVMYAGTPVIACNSGGPLETIVHGETGLLCDPTPQSFAHAMKTLLQSLETAKAMGQAGRQHVIDKFGTAVMQQEWNRLTQQAHQRGQQRHHYFWSSSSPQLSSSSSSSQQQQQQQPQRSIVVPIIVYLVEAVLALLGCLLLTLVLRRLGWLEPNESILGCMRRRLQSDEL